MSPFSPQQTISWITINKISNFIKLIYSLVHGVGSTGQLPLLAQRLGPVTGWVHRAERRRAKVAETRGARVWPAGELEPVVMEGRDVGCGHLARDGPDKATMGDKLTTAALLVSWPGRPWGGCGQCCCHPATPGRKRPGGPWGVRRRSRTRPWSRGSSWNWNIWRNHFTIIFF